MVGRTFQMEAVVGLKTMRKCRDEASPPTPPIPLARMLECVLFLGQPIGNCLFLSFLPFFFLLSFSSSYLLQPAWLLIFFPPTFPLSFIFSFLQSSSIKKNFFFFTFYFSLPSFPSYPGNPVLWVEMWISYTIFNFK